VNTRLVLPNLLGGVSRQPPAARHVNQVEAADNWILSLSEGLAKRPGSRRITAVAGLGADADLRMHGIDRDGTEQYLLIIGDGVLRVFAVDGTEAIVAAETEATAYLAANSATAAQLRPTTVADYTVIVNTTVNVATETSAAYTVAQEYPTYSIIASHSPADGAYYKAAESDAGHPAGYWRHDVGSATWATFETRKLGATWVDPNTWIAAGRNPGGYKIAFTHTTMDYGSGDPVSWHASQKQLTKAGAFADYEWSAGDQINISGGTVTKSGWIEIVAKRDSDTLVLAEEIHASDQTDIETDGIGREYEVLQDLQRETFTDMYDVAAALQEALRRAGATDALVGWTYTAAQEGHITITSPYRGAEAQIAHPTAPDSGYSYVVDATTDGPFRNSGTGTTLTDGTGTPTGKTLDPIDRWTRVAPPDQSGAVLSAETMPVRLVRRHVSGFYGDDYPSTILADEPWAYWRLGEGAGSTAADELGVNDGTYVGSPTLAQSSLTDRDADTSVAFNGSSQYVNCGKLGQFGSTAATAGITIELWVKTASNGATLAGSGTYGAQRMTLDLAADGKLWLRIEGRNGGGYRYIETDADVGIDDNAAHHVAATWDAATGEMRIYVDGQRVDATLQQTDTPDLWEDLGDEFAIAASSAGAGWYGYAAATIDEVALYARPLSAWRIASHYFAGVQATAAVFQLDTIDWAPRYSGDTETNPTPSLWADERTISDVSFHRNRLVLAGDENIVFSQAGDFWNFWLEDPENIGDADPIDVALSAEKVTLVDYVVPFRKALVIFTQADQQFELNAPEVLTPNTAAVTPSTAQHSLSGVRPATMGSALYFGSVAGAAGQVREYYYDEHQAANDTVDISSHVVGYLPAALQTIEAAANLSTLVVLGENASVFYIYRQHYSGDQKVQAAWSRFTADDGERIVDVAVIGSDAYALIENASGYFLVRYPLAAQGADTGMDCEIRLDHTQTVTGSNAAGYTTWTYGVDDDTVDTVVLGAAFDGAGEIVADTEPAGTTAIRVADAAGDYAGDPCYVGRRFTSTVTLSRPFQRDRNSTAVLDNDMRLRTLIVNHAQAAGYTVRIGQPNRANRDVAFLPRGSDRIEADGIHRVFVQGKADDTTVTIFDTSPYPLTLAGLEIIADITRERST